MALNHWDK